MVITDHINLIPNPLIGPNDPELGPRFPDMSEPYDAGLIALAAEVACREGIQLQYGCYIGVTGPTFETRKEYRFYRTAGSRYRRHVHDAGSDRRESCGFAGIRRVDHYKHGARRDEVDARRGAARRGEGRSEDDAAVRRYARSALVRRFRVRRIVL